MWIDCTVGSHLKCNIVMCHSCCLSCTVTHTLERAIKGNKKIILFASPELSLLSFNWFAFIHLFMASNQVHLWLNPSDTYEGYISHNPFGTFSCGIYNEDEGGQHGRVEGGGAFIFSASHVIFIVSKTHLAFLLMQGLVAGRGGGGRERREVAGKNYIRTWWNKGSGEADIMEMLRICKESRQRNWRLNSSQMNFGTTWLHWQQHLINLHMVFELWTL